MKEIKIYELIKYLLTERPELRDSDKKLIWAVWQHQALAEKSYITYDNFIKAENMETIRRTRQKLQETTPALRSSNSVQRQRQEKQRSKGTFIYREKTTVFDDETNTVKFI